MPFLATRSANSARGFGFAGRVITLPGIPTGFSAVGKSATNSNGGALIYFTAPTDTGGAPITKYQVQNTTTSVITDITASGQTVPLAVNSGAQNFRIRAVNSAGAGDWTTTDSAQCGYTEVGSIGNLYGTSASIGGIPTGATVTFVIYSGSGSTDKPDTRTYGTFYRYYFDNWYDNYGTGYGANWADGYYHPYVNGYDGPTSSMIMGQNSCFDYVSYKGSWWGYDPNYNYLYGTLMDMANNFVSVCSYQYTGFNAGNASSYWGWSPGTQIGGVYWLFKESYIDVVSGTPAYGPQYGNSSILYDNSTTYSITNDGYNNSPDIRSGQFTKSHIGGNIQYSLGAAVGGSNYPGEYPYASAGGRLFLGWGI